MLLGIRRASSYKEGDRTTRGAAAMAMQVDGTDNNNIPIYTYILYIYFKGIHRIQTVNDNPENPEVIALPGRFFQFYVFTYT